MKFLIIRFSSIGDIVLTTPVIRCLKKQVPGAEIHFLTKKQFEGILSPNPYIDKLHVLGKDLSAVIEDLKRENFDCIIDLHKNLRTLRVKAKLGVKSFSFNKLNIEKWLLTAWKINRLPDIHIVDRNLQTLTSFGVLNDGEGLDYFIPQHSEVDIKTLPDTMRQGYIGVVTGAAHATKRLTPDQLKILCSDLPVPVILLGGKEDQTTGEYIVKANPGMIYNGCGKFSLAESASIVKQSRLIVTHDTGLMHIAAAFKKPVISIWGNTIPGFGMYAYYGKYKVPYVNFEVNGLSCRPCSKIGYDRCPKKHFRCMLNQNIPAIRQTILEFLNVDF